MTVESNRAAPSFAILLGGVCVATPRLRAQLAGMRVIAADGGMIHAETLGLEPELWVGDFDSTPPALLARQGTVETLRFDRDKDMSDGAIAIAEARKRGARALLLVGALGGARADHQMALMMQAAALCEEGLPVLLSSGIEEAAVLLPGEMRADYPAGTIFSVIGLGPLSGLSVQGARWPLSRVAVASGSTLTLSNEAAGPVTLRLEAGRALVIAQIGTR